jgi:medium-chain acyl-[acyl-carrier-protein] hydrolase
MTDSIYYFSFQVSTKDCTSRQTIKLPNLLDYMQEAAWYNATCLGFSTLDLMKHGHTWVMNRMKITFHRHPKHSEKCTIETWPADMDKYYTRRDFRIYNEDNILLAEATSNWLVMDIEERKLMAIPAYIREARLITNRNNIQGIEGKLKYDETKTQYKLPIAVSWFDLDINDHVNNTKFYQWVLDCLPGEYLQNHLLKTIDITFRHEAKYGDTLESMAYSDQDQNVYFHALKNIQTQQVSVIASTAFTTIDN